MPANLWKTSSGTMGRGDPPICYNTLSSPDTDPMILSQASRLSDRQTVWVSYRNDGSAWNECPDLVYPVGIPATVIAAQFSEVHRSDVRQMQWG